MTTTSESPAVPSTADLWRACGPAARDARKRGIAMRALVWSVLVLVVGAVVWRLPAPSFGELRRPLGYVLDPAKRSAEVAFDVVDEGLERRDVDDARP